MDNFRKEQDMKQTKVVHYRKLRGRIVERYGTLSQYAEAIGLSLTSLSAKLNRKTDFTGKEIRTWCSLLGIATEDIGAYFFDD